MSKKSKAISISIEEANTASRAARKQVGRKKSQPQFAGVKNVEGFNRWLKESYAEFDRKVG